jgi:hypothetical protein
VTARKTAAAKKAASSKTTSASTTDKAEDQANEQANEQDGAEGNDQDTGQGSGEATFGTSARDVGPGTGTTAPGEGTSRPPASIVNTDPGAAPLAPPADHPTQTEPEQGHASSSTDQVYAAAAGQTIAGENHKRLVDQRGNTLSADDLFTDPGGLHTYLVVKVRVFEEFTYPNTKRTSRRLLYVPGAKVPRFQAARLMDAVRSAAPVEPASDSDTSEE